MCDCITKTTEKLKDLFPDAMSVEYENIELLSGRVYSTINITLQGKKKPKKQYLIHSYCPMCGEKYAE